jgi:hypothetical protein
MNAICEICGAVITPQNRIHFNFPVCVRCNARVFALELGTPDQIKKIDLLNYEFDIAQGRAPRERNFYE